MTLLWFSQQIQKLADFSYITREIPTPLHGGSKAQLNRDRFMRVDAFDFILPDDRIAKRPAEPRESARLLQVTAPGALSDLRIADLTNLLRAGDVMVFNDTRVIPARLFGTRGDVAVEILLHLSEGDGVWQVFARPAKRLKPGHVIQFEGLEAEVLGRLDGGLVRLQFNMSDAALFAQLEAIGHMPLPPYIDRDDDAQDRADYQTVYAAKDGAVAAPTAGLHFTEDLLGAIDAKGVTRTHVTLHVGAGTFLPVKVDDTEDHDMHAEVAHLSAETAQVLSDAKSEGRRIIAVGTTALRTLESATVKDGVVEPFSATTDLFITPGYGFKLADVLMTNFHLPRSTLFMLVSAFSGLETMQAAYAHAISSGYRFYSYGDACWLERPE